MTLLVLQNADMVTDIALLPANYDMWTEMGVQTEPFPVKLNVPYTSLIWEAIHKTGGGADYVSEIILKDATVSKGRLCYGPKKYGTIFLVEVAGTTVETLEKLDQFVSTGGRVFCIGKYPEKSLGFLDYESRDAQIRSMVDKLKANREPLMAQTLLTPVAVDLDADEYDAVLGNLSLLQEFAFACEDFGGGTVLVRQVPADIRAEDTAATLEELARKLVRGRADPEAARDELLHTMACKSAIKAGMTSDVSELAALVEKVQSGEIQYCPHGRPVKYKLSKYEIEKFFKRA